MSVITHAEERASHTALGHGDRGLCMSEIWRVSMPMMQLALMDRNRYRSAVEANSNAYKEGQYHRI